MRKLFLAVICSLVLLSASVVNAEARKVCVVYEDNNVLVLYNDWGDDYTIVDMYTGFVNEGDWLHGEIASYGFHDFYNITRDSKIRCYIEEYWQSQDDVIAWLRHNR